ncbi:MAG: ABC transporter substrate-binding protein [Saccharofermentanales bacterium]
MKKRTLLKLVTLMLSLVLVLSVIGCGSSDDKDSKDSKEASETEGKAADDSSESKDDAKKDGFVIGFSNGYWGNTWRAQMVDDFEKEIQKYIDEGIVSEYMVSNSENDATEQLNQINSMIDSGVDAIMIDPVSPTTVQSAVEKAIAQGILVVITNDPAAYENTVCVAGNNYAWQKIQVKWLVEQLDGKGDIVEISGVPGNAADTLRQDANKDVLADYPDINILGSAPGSWSQTEAQSVMTTFLSTYENIDAVLAQDVMAEGILKAYENAGKDVPVMTGDYTKSFFNVWQENPDMNTIGVPYAPGNAVVALDVTVRLLQGKTIKEEVLVANPFDENMINTIMVDPPYVVTKDGDQNAPWMEGLRGSKAITLEEAVELLKDSPDTAALDGWLSAEEADELFE